MIGPMTGMTGKLLFGLLPLDFQLLLAFKLAWRLEVRVVDGDRGFIFGLCHCLILDFFGI